MSNKARERIIRQKEKGYPLVQSVLLHRAGSGRRLVDEAPSEEWVKQMKYLRFQGYTGYMCLVIAPEYRCGYEGYPGCELIFLPGDQDGMHMDVESCEWLHIRKSQDLSRYTFGAMGSGNFALSISFRDLQNIHKAIGKALMSMSRFKDKLK